jgi:hypothetical protein
MSVAGPEQCQAGRPENVLCFELSHRGPLQFLHAGGDCPRIVEQRQVRQGGWKVLFLWFLQPLVSVVFHITLMANNCDGLSATG